MLCIVTMSMPMPRQDVEELRSALEYIFPNQTEQEVQAFIDKVCLHLLHRPFSSFSHLPGLAASSLTPSSLLVCGNAAKWSGQVRLRTLARAVAVLAVA